MAGVWVGVTSGLWAAGLAEAGSAASVEVMLEVSAGGASEVWAARSVEGGSAEATLKVLAEVTAEVLVGVTSGRWVVDSVEAGSPAWAEFTGEAVQDSPLASTQAVTMAASSLATAILDSALTTTTATTDATHRTDGVGPPTATDAANSLPAPRPAEPHAVPAYANRVSSQTLWR